MGVVSAVVVSTVVAVSTVVEAAVAAHASAARGSKVELGTLLSEARASQAELATSRAIVAQCLQPRVRREHFRNAD